MHFRIRYFILLLCTGFIWVACAGPEDNQQLQKVLNAVDTDPQEALRLLDDMPVELLNRDHLMRYVVLRKQAAYMDHQDISGDTLILAAQHYFAKKHNPEMAARASYYAASFYREMQLNDRAIEYYLFSGYYAQQADNRLFMAKSAHWIGNIYYDRDMLDSARVYYQQALELYDRESNVDLDRLDLVFILGRTYREMQQFDQAFSCFSNGLEAAQKLDNKNYELLFLYNKGIVLREIKEYTQAKEYFSQALSKKPDTEDSLRIYLSYARLYRATRQPDSTLFYLDQVKNRISEITYPNSRRAVYQELADYHKFEGDIEEMEHFLNLANEEDRKIKAALSEEKLLLVTQRFEQFKQKAEQKYSKTLEMVLTIIIVLGFLLLVSWADNRERKKFYKEMRSRHTLERIDIQNFLLGSLQIIADKMEELRMMDQTINPKLSIEEQFEEFRAGFIAKIAELTRDLLDKSLGRTDALPQLTSEDLFIIYLSHLKYSDESILRLLGYKFKSTDYVMIRRSQIRNILAEAGVKDLDLKILFPFRG